MPPEVADIQLARAEAIRVERARQRLKQQEVADKAKLNQATVARAENGQGSAEVYAAIAEALGIELPEVAL